MGSPCWYRRGGSPDWITRRQGRSAEAGQDDFSRWDLRQEIEDGVTDRHQVPGYLNQKAQSYRDPDPGESDSSFEFKGISLENQYHFLNPARQVVGFTGYLEGTYNGDEAEVEQKLIFGQRHGNWK